jgi:YidC/Oxa1 family membrane protein insertase
VASIRFPPGRPEGEREAQRVMNKKDYLLFAILIGLMMSWPYIDRHVIKRYFYPESPISAAALDTNEVATAEPPSLKQAKPDMEGTAAAPEALPPAEEPGEPAATGPEQTVGLDNGRASLVLTSRGAGVKTATLSEYRETVEKDSGPVVIDFAGAEALAYEGLPGLSAGQDFDMSKGADDRSVVFSRRSASGLKMTRTMTLLDGFVLDVVDVIENGGDAPANLAEYTLRLGPMHQKAATKDARGIVYLGVDSLSPGGEGVQHWGTRVAKWFKEEQTEKGLPKLPVSIARPPQERPVDWVAVKNKYFVQILTPADGADGFRMSARRDVTPKELENPAFKPPMTPLVEVGASILLPGLTLQPGESVERKMQYYVGPKKFTELHARRMRQVDVMEFGMWAPVGKVLLQVLNGIHRILPNYGVAIMLLTVIIRVLFWPITHKSTESMKKMAAVQPLINQLREKHKDNPQRMQQEIMALYKEHKVNPLGGCIPMLVQIPVFIALFVVLRSAIELRFAPFLWIQDLSEPERLFADVLPIPLNLLPLLMCLTMFWQQKLTPTAGDPQQQKIMMVMMPVMMLFLLYNFASGLALYWTTQNVLMIVQQLMMKRKQPVPAKA